MLEKLVRMVIESVVNEVFGDLINRFFIIKAIAEKNIDLGVRIYKFRFGKSIINDFNKELNKLPYKTSGNYRRIRIIDKVVRKYVTRYRVDITRTVCRKIFADANEQLVRGKYPTIYMLLDKALNGGGKLTDPEKKIIRNKIIKSSTFKKFISENIRPDQLSSVERIWFYNWEDVPKGIYAWYFKKDPNIQLSKEFDLMGSFYRASIRDCKIIKENSNYYFKGRFYDEFNFRFDIFTDIPLFGQEFSFLDSFPLRVLGNIAFKLQEVGAMKEVIIDINLKVDVTNEVKRFYKK